MKAPLLIAVLLLSSCSPTPWRAPLVGRNDTLPLLPSPMQAKKVTITGPVNFITQLGSGNAATPTATDNTKAGQRATAAAIGAGSTATATQKSMPWYIYAALVLLLIGAGFLLRSKLAV